MEGSKNGYFLHRAHSLEPCYPPPEPLKVPPVGQLPRTIFILHLRSARDKHYISQLYMYNFNWIWRSKCATHLHTVYRHLRHRHTYTVHACSCTHCTHMTHTLTSHIHTHRMTHCTQFGYTHHTHMQFL